MSKTLVPISKAQISRAAIERLYIAMRHLFIRGSYKPLGVSGEAIRDALLDLEPEIYGTIADPEKVELDGLLYIFQRLPLGIEECRYVKLISREGYEKSEFQALVPAKRRRNCYRIDEEQMYIEMSRGRSDIYDVLTHLSFMYIEAEKISSHALDHKGRVRREWKQLEEIIHKIKAKKKFNLELGITHLSTLLGRTYEETAEAVKLFEKAKKVNSLFNIVYWLGYHSIAEKLKDEDREISFSSTLRENLGMHIFGSIWAQNLKAHLEERNLLDHQIHIISANMHSVRNTIYAIGALQTKSNKKVDLDKLILALAQEKTKAKNKKVQAYAEKNGMSQLQDDTGTNIGVQVIDMNQVDKAILPAELKSKSGAKKTSKKVIVVMDYAFGEQAYECMDELLKPYEKDNTKIPLDVKSINIMGKAGILKGEKGDIMVPSAHIFEGSADNYPFKNSLTAKELEATGLKVCTGPMITVLGTSLQNKDILRYFLRSSWKVIGLEMEGAHYQKAIQAASAIRNNIAKKVTLRYAYYASDNPLLTGSTLASGGLGAEGVKPTYAITTAILKGILS